MTAGHPRLYFTADELERLRKRRARGIHARLWKNLAASADECLAEPLRREWIAPKTPDPIYENLYDRFYAMMHDMAVMEHLAFAFAYSGARRYFDAARAWTLACARVWSREADGAPDASKAYAVMRLLKGVATGYDLLYQDLAPDERAEIRDVLTRIGRSYYAWYLADPSRGTEKQGAHHASVEASSFGVTALALRGEVPEAEDWLRLMVQKHVDHLLPRALAPSGAQTEGRTFWASTMQYRFFFLDALRRVTGRDLFPEFAAHLDGRMALACVAAPKTPGHDENFQTILFEPSYGQLNYWSPALLFLARARRSPTLQYFALWDQTLGAMQKTRYVTAHGEQLLFTLGGYAYAWYDPSVPAHPESDLPLSFEFPEVDEAYVRASFRKGALVAGVRRGLVQVHAGGRPVWIDRVDPFGEPRPLARLTREDSGGEAVLHCIGGEDTAYASQALTLRRPGLLTIRRKTKTAWQGWYQGRPARRDNRLAWPDGTTLTVAKGTLSALDPAGFEDWKSVGNGKLKLADPMPMRYPLVTVTPDDGEIVLEIRTRDRAERTGR